MKKIISMLLCALLMMLPALAEAPIDAPNAGDGLFPGDQLPRDGDNGGDAGASVTLEINGETIRLGFDDSPLYSSVQNGLVQASYSAYGADGYTMYLLYIIFPDTAKPGTVITPESAATAGNESSVVLIVSSRERELYYYSSVFSGQVYPADSTFSIAIDNIEAADNGTTYSGTLSATLICIDTAQESEIARQSIPETPFRFTIAGYRDPGAAPGNTPPAEDMRKV